VSLSYGGREGLFRWGYTYNTPPEPRGSLLRACAWPPEVVLYEARSEVGLLRRDRVRTGL
jgi:hypothetical protein